MGALQRLKVLSDSPYAVLDLGTNTFHLLIAVPDHHGGWIPLKSMRHTVKIGRGGIHENKISHDAMNRAISALGKFSVVLEKHQVVKIKALATSAIRSASNRQQFIHAVRKKTGIHITPISGAKEAALIMEGVRHTLPENIGRTLVMDIGGGSVEFILSEEGTTLWKRSFKIGAARLVEMFCPSDPLLMEEHDAIRQHIFSAIKPLQRALRQYPTDILIGSSGSFESYSAMIAASASKTDPMTSRAFSSLNRTSISKLHDRLVRSTSKERRKMAGLVRMRVDMIVPAIILTELVISRFGMRRIHVSSHALKEGAMTRLIRTGRV